VHLVSTPAVAEMTKLLENTYRGVNVALINEMAQLAHQLDIDIWEVVSAAATKPFGFQAFVPGPGVGGHCIPLDPQYLAWQAKRVGFTTRFIDLADEANRYMPVYVADRVEGLLKRRGVAVAGAKVLGVGLAFKANVSDDRESPAVDVLRELTGRGAEVSVWDPLVEADRIEGRGFKAVEDADGDYAVAVILADHDVFDYRALATAVPAVFDARGAFARRGLNAANVEDL
jgi:UDP-N-acetyl-D-glucosamine dehydrogenase